MTNLERRLRSLGDSVRSEGRLTPRRGDLHRIRGRRVLTAASGLLSLAVVVTGTAFLVGLFPDRGSPEIAAVPNRGDRVLVGLFPPETTFLELHPGRGLVCYDEQALTGTRDVESVELFDESSAETVELFPGEAYILGTDGRRCTENVDAELQRRVLGEPAAAGLRISEPSGDVTVLPLLPWTRSHRVLARGEVLGETWRFIGYRQGNDTCVEVALARSSGGGCGFSILRRPLQVDGSGSGSVKGRLVEDIYGRVSKRVETLEFRTRARVVPVDLIEIPDVFGLRGRAFVIVLPASELGEDARIAAYSREGRLIESAAVGRDTH